MEVHLCKLRWCNYINGTIKALLKLPTATYCLFAHVSDESSVSLPVKFSFTQLNKYSSLLKSSKGMTLVSFTNALSRILIPRIYRETSALCLRSLDDRHEPLVGMTSHKQYWAVATARPGYRFQFCNLLAPWTIMFQRLYVHPGGKKKQQKQKTYLLGYHKDKWLKCKHDNEEQWGWSPTVPVNVHSPFTLYVPKSPDTCDS